MPKRYRLALFAQAISTAFGRKEAASDGWFYPKDAAEEDAFLKAGCQFEELLDPNDIPSQAASPGTTFATTAALALALVSGSGVAAIGSGLTTLDEAILLGSDMYVNVQPGAVLRSVGVYQHTLIRFGNAEFKADALPIPGVTVYCADEAASSGVGTLRYTSGTTSLAWKAPGDTAFGAEVDISSVSSVATVAYFHVFSANGSGIYLYVDSAVRTSQSRSVRVEPVTGAKPVTWTRSGNVRTVLEPGYKRKVGDFVIHFGPTGDTSFGYITSVNATGYTFPDIGVDQAVAQAGRAYGVRNTRFNGNGARLEYNKNSLTTTLMSNLHAVIMLACSDCDVLDLEINDTTKYDVLITGYKNCRVRVSAYRASSADLFGNSDIIHPLGPGKVLFVERPRAQGGDNLVGIGCSDNQDYIFHPPAYGDISIEDTYIEPMQCEDTDQQPVRIYNANGTNFVRRTWIKPVTGTYSSGTDSAVAVMSDLSAPIHDAGATNIDGLFVLSPDAVRSDGVVTAAVTLRGYGTCRNVQVRGLKPRQCNGTIRGTVSVERVVDDLLVECDAPAAAFGGAIVNIVAGGFVGVMDFAGKNLNADNTVGGGYRPTLVKVDSPAAGVALLRVNGVVVDDVSSSGSKLALVQSAGYIGRALFNGCEAKDGDSAVRLDSTATGILCTFTVTTPTTVPVAPAIYTNNGATFNVIYAQGTMVMAVATGAPAASGALTKSSGTGDASITFSAVVTQGNYVNNTLIPGSWLGGDHNLFNTTFGVVCDAAPSELAFTDTKQLVAVSSSFFQNSAATAATIRMNCRGIVCSGAAGSNRFLRNTAGNHTYLWETDGVEVGGNYFQVDAGTPLVRLLTNTNVPFAADTQLDSTVANHRAGVGFYNTAAGFGAGVGAYVRGATTWTRVAA